MLQRWCSTCLLCVHTTDTKRKQRKARVQNILKSSEKTQYLMNTLYNQKPAYSIIANNSHHIETPQALLDIVSVWVDYHYPHI